MTRAANRLAPSRRRILRPGGTGRTALALIAVLSLIAAACGIPEDDNARLIAAGQEPFDPDPPPSTTTTLPEQLTEEVTFWLIEQTGETDKVRPVIREIERGSDGITLQKTIDELLRVTKAEDNPDEETLFTAIPAGTILASPVDYREANNVAVINLSGARISDLADSRTIVEQISAQLVFTLSTLSLKDFADREEIGLRLQIDGENQRVTSTEVGSGPPVRKSDYCPYDPDIELCEEPPPVTPETPPNTPQPNQPTNPQPNNPQPNNPQPSAPQNPPNNAEAPNNPQNPADTPGNPNNSQGDGNAGSTPNQPAETPTSRPISDRNPPTTPQGQANNQNQPPNNGN